VVMIPVEKHVHRGNQLREIFDAIRSPA